ncbi:hypothetical protein BD779DRAFT_1469487 [Infundibulicybe gibba]|nr:hypothetical protein BD779DRAFT_1469487 [Infundibulicybe gibba]
MTGWLPPPDDDGIQWMKAMSKNGVPFRVGIKKAEHSIEGGGIEEESEVLVAQEASRVGIGEASQILRTGVPVNWPVGDTTWKLSESRVEDAVGISRYRLYPNHVYSTPYRLEFTNIRGRSFVFGDESGDLYSITTPFNGNHTLQYDSRLPNIRYAYIRIW